MGILALSYNQISSILSVGDCIDAVDRAFRSYARGKASVAPNRIFHQFGGDTASIFSIGGVILDEDVLIIKNLTLNWSNPEHRRMPHMYGTILLCNASTGEPKCIMDAVYITNIRTGAVAGVAAKYMANKNSKKVAVIGSKEIAKFSALAVKAVLPSVNQMVVFSKTRRNRELFVAEMTNKISCEIVAADKVEDAVKDADIVITATNANEPIIFPNTLKNGVFLDSVGSREEVDPAVLSNMKVIVESAEACRQHGKFSAALKNGMMREEDLFCELAEIVSGDKKARQSEEESLMFDSVGLAIEDAAIAKLAYVRAGKMKLGSELELFEGLHE